MTPASSPGCPGSSPLIHTCTQPERSGEVRCFDTDAIEPAACRLCLGDVRHGLDQVVELTVLRLVGVHP